MASTKSDRRKAEPASEWYAREVEQCVVVIRAIRSQFQRQDLFAADVLGKRANGSLVAIQTTAAERANNVRVRRRKLEAIPWRPDDTVMVLQLVSLPHPASKARRQKWFRIHRYDVASGKWANSVDTIEIPPHWMASSWQNHHKAALAVAITAEETGAPADLKTEDRF